MHALLPDWIYRRSGVVRLNLRMNRGRMFVWGQLFTTNLHLRIVETAISRQRRRGAVPEAVV